MKTYKTTIEKPRLIIKYDDDAMSPRENDNLGYFITVDKDHHSPDRNEELETIVSDTGDQANDLEDHVRLIKKEVDDVIAIYPITKYEHSGVSYSLGSKVGFDHSNNGFYIITDKSIKEIGARNDKKSFERFIKDELDLYNKWINGEVFRFTLYDNDGEVVDSCGGFYELDDIKDYLPKEWKDEDLNDYLIN